MKRLIFLLIFALALSACSANEAEEPDDSASEDTNQQTEEEMEHKDLHQQQFAQNSPYSSMILMNWTYGYDYFEPYMDADKLAEAMISGEGPEVDVDYSLLKPGANLLMHDREWTNEALERIVNGLRDSGYEIVDPHLIQTLDEASEKE